MATIKTAIYCRRSETRWKHMRRIIIKIKAKYRVKPALVASNETRTIRKYVWPARLPGDRGRHHIIFTRRWYISKLEEMIALKIRGWNGAYFNLKFKR